MRVGAIVKTIVSALGVLVCVGRGLVVHGIRPVTRVDETRDRICLGWVAPRSVPDHDGSSVAIGPLDSCHRDHVV